MRLLLIISATCIFALGLVMVFGTSSAEFIDTDVESQSFFATHYAMIKQIFYAFFGICIAYICSFVGHSTLMKISSQLLWLNTALLALCFLPGVGVIRNGAARWIGFGGYTLQPSELLKLTLPLCYIYAVTSNKELLTDMRLLLRELLRYVLPLGLVLLEPDNGTLVVLLMSLVGLFFLSGLRIKYWALPLAVFVLVAGILALQMPYVMARIEIYLNPELDLLGKGHQPYQARIAAGSGGLWGVGLGASMQKLSYLPEAQNDYIAAIFAEEFGFVGVLILIALYMILALSGYMIALRSRTKEAFYLAAILCFVLSIQAFFNLGVVSGLLPSTGMNLPLFSQGGSSLIASIVSLGLLLEIESRI